MMTDTEMTKDERMSRRRALRRREMNLTAAVLKMTRTVTELEAVKDLLATEVAGLWEEDVLALTRVEVEVAMVRARVQGVRDSVRDEISASYPAVD